MEMATEFLYQQLTHHRDVLQDLMVIDNGFLTLLVRESVLDVNDCTQIQQSSENADKVELILERVHALESDATYRHFLQALHLSGQTELEDLLSSPECDLTDLNYFCRKLESCLEELQFLNLKESRRSGVNFDDTSGVDGSSEQTLKELLSVAEITRLINSQFDRTKTVIAKLHDDCNNVARINCDIMEQIHQCDAKIRENLLYRKKGQIPPQRSQEVFEHLIKDIHELNKQYSREVIKDSETKLPCLRLVRQCDDWIQNRISDLKTGSQSDHLRHKPVQPRETGNNVKQSAKEFEGNVLKSSETDQLLDSLTQLERHLQQYMSCELHTTDGLRRVLRIRHLQRSSESLTSGSVRNLEAILIQAETPANKDRMQGACALLNNIASEYDECVSVLQRFVRKTSTVSNMQEPSRRKVGKPKKGKPKGGNSAVKDAGYADSVSSSHVQPKYILLQMINDIITAHQTLIEELGTVKTRYQADVDRRKRECESVLQRQTAKCDQLIIQVHELTAEKDKFKRLYEAAKVSFLHKPHKAIAQTNQQTASIEDKVDWVFITQSTNNE